jgi:hypothetical protein
VNVGFKAFHTNPNCNTPNLKCVSDAPLQAKKKPSVGAKGVEVSMQAALSDRPTQATPAPPHSTRNASASDAHPHATACVPADGDVEAGTAFDVIMGAGSESATAAKSRHSSRASSRRGSREEEHMHLLADDTGGGLELSLAGTGVGLAPPFAAHARVE